MVKTSFAKFQAVLSAQLRWFSTAAAMITRPDRRAALSARADDMPNRLAAVDEAFEAGLALYDDEDIDISSEQQETFESDYKQVLDFADSIQECLAVHKSGDFKDPTSRNSSVGARALESRLPTLQLPHFDGQIDAWLGFIGLFESLVDARTDLSEAQKMAYLLASLKGEALGLVQHLSVADGSYATAREILRRRYHDVRRLADAQVGHILNLPKISRVSTLRQDILNPVLVATNDLKRLGLPVDQWSFLLLHIVLAKLPGEMRLRFERMYGGDSPSHLPSYEDLQTFLEDECRRVDTAEAAVTREQPKTWQDHPSARLPRSVPRPRFGAVGEEFSVTCSYCKRSGHAMIACPRFLAVPLQGRRDIAKERRLCYFCLGSHFQRECRRPRPCEQCGGSHHLVLCANRNRIGSDEGGDERRAPRRADRVFVNRSSPPRGQYRGGTGGGGRPSSPRHEEFGAAEREPMYSARRRSPPSRERSGRDQRSPRRFMEPGPLEPYAEVARGSQDVREDRDRDRYQSPSPLWRDSVPQ